MRCKTYKSREGETEKRELLLCRLVVFVRTDSLEVRGLSFSDAHFFHHFVGQPPCGLLVQMRTQFSFLFSTLLSSFPRKRTSKRGDHLPSQSESPPTSGRRQLSRLVKLPCLVQAFPVLSVLPVTFIPVRPSCEQS